MSTRIPIIPKTADESSKENAWTFDEKSTKEQPKYQKPFATQQLNEDDDEEQDDMLWRRKN